MAEFSHEVSQYLTSDTVRSPLGSVLHSSNDLLSKGWPLGVAANCTGLHDTEWTCHSLLEKLVQHHSAMALNSHMVLSSSVSLHSLSGLLTRDCDFLLVPPFWQSYLAQTVADQTLPCLVLNSSTQDIYIYIYQLVIKSYKFYIGVKQSFGDHFWDIDSF